MDRPLWQRSAVEMRDGMDAGDFSAREVVDSVILRMAEGNPGLNAVVEDYSDQARAAADASGPNRSTPSPATRSSVASSPRAPSAPRPSSDRS